MNKLHIVLAGMALMASVSAPTASAWDLKDVLGGSNVGESVADFVEGVFTKTNLQVADLVGTWTSDGSAVSFKSDNMLKKAGGVAAATALESKLNPYYKKYGLTGAVITITEDAKFTIQVKKLKISGTVERNDDGSFEFKFKVTDSVKLGSLTTYVQKSGDKMDIMFDATKMKNLVSSIAGLTGNNMVKTFGSLLESYDGICVGFSTRKN